MGLAVRRRQNPAKKIAESLCTRLRASGSGDKNPLSDRSDKMYHKTKYKTYRTSLKYLPKYVFQPVYSSAQHLEDNTDIISFHPNSNKKRLVC